MAAHLLRVCVCCRWISLSTNLRVVRDSSLTTRMIRTMAIHQVRFVWLSTEARRWCFKNNACVMLVCLTFYKVDCGVSYLVWGPKFNLWRVVNQSSLQTIFRFRFDWYVGRDYLHPKISTLLPSHNSRAALDTRNACDKKKCALPLTVRSGCTVLPVCGFRAIAKNPCFWNWSLNNGVSKHPGVFHNTCA